MYTRNLPSTQDAAASSRLPQKAAAAFRCVRLLKRSAVVLTLALNATVAFAQAPNLGKSIRPAEIASWDINILPDGSGLPPGSGTPAEAARVYAEKCSAC